MIIYHIVFGNQIVQPSTNFKHVKIQREIVVGIALKTYMMSLVYPIIQF